MKASRYETGRCEMCGERTRASGPHCRSCQSLRHHARKDVESGAVLIDETLPGSWWIFAKKTGVVLVMDEPSKDAAVKAYVDGAVRVSVAEDGAPC